MTKFNPQTRNAHAFLPLNISAVGSVIRVAILVANWARSEYTRLRCKWTKKWKGKYVIDETPHSILLYIIKWLVQNLIEASKTASVLAFQNVLYFVSFNPCQSVMATTNNSYTPSPWLPWKCSESLFQCTMVGCCEISCLVDFEWILLSFVGWVQAAR